MPAAFRAPTDAIVSDAPPKIRRAVRRGECDPVGIVHTPRFPDCCVSAYEAFLGQMLDRPLRATIHALGADFPDRGVELDFRSPLPLETSFTMEARVGEIGTRTFDLRIVARHVAADCKRAGPVAFLVRLTPVVVNLEASAGIVSPEAP